MNASRLPAVFCCCLLLASLLPGCSSSSYLPSSKEIVRSPWQSFDEVKASFDRITPYETTSDELAQLGFDPFTTPNIKMLNYLDIMSRFMPNQSITISDLSPGLQDCLADRELCRAYEINLRQVEHDRYGNVLLDLFSFRRKTTISGWEFNAIIVLEDDLVVYKVWGGKPRVDENQDRKNPLGPLQSSEKLLWNVAQ